MKRKRRKMKERLNNINKELKKSQKRKRPNDGKDEMARERRIATKKTKMEGQN